MNVLKRVLRYEAVSSAGLASSVSIIEKIDVREVMSERKRELHAERSIERRTFDRLR
jgi:hypothetical protein